ncbi:MAG: O-antigen ligase family protein [Verrucomicrobiae bacterium]|nr:O-antigen ligase family protein [Verrucomicrobiae bacterium]
MNPSGTHALRVWEWRVWVLLLYAIPLHEGAKNSLWFLMLLLTVARGIAERRGPSLDVGGWGILAWLGAGLWSTAFAIEPDASGKGLWDLARGAGMFIFAAGACDTPSRREATVRHVLLAAAFASALGASHTLRALIHHEWKIERLALQIASVGQYNQSGAWLAMAWAFALAVEFQPRLIHGKALRIAAVSLVGGALVSTTSRSAIAVAFAVTLGMFGIARPRRRFRAALLLLIPCVLSLLTMYKPFRERLTFRGSFHNRVAIWHSAWSAVQERPWTGVGLNNFKNILLATDDSIRFATVDHAHNLYVNSLAQGGWPGLATLLAMLGATGIVAARLRRAPAADARLVFPAALGVWGVVVLNGFSNTSLHHELSMIFFTAMGLASAAAAKTPDGESVRADGSRS